MTRASGWNAFGSHEDLFKAALAAHFAQSPDRALHNAPGASGLPARLGSAHC